MLKTAALIPAAGRGERLGKGPKAFLTLKEKTILEVVISCFKPHVDEIVIAVSEDMLEKAKDYADSKTKIVIGGKTRQATVYELIKNTAADIVLIHDAARPFLSKEIIEKSIETAMLMGAAVVVKPLHDSVLDVKSQQSLNRDDFVAVQTPQSFRRELILRAHEQAIRDGVVATDDAGLVRMLGHEVSMVEGGSWLDKITSVDDFQRAQALVELWDDN